MVDYFIVGFGISGACIAKVLEDQGQSFYIFNDQSQCASRVAGGLYNPVVLKRFKLAWQGDKQLKEAMAFYGELENRLESTFLRPLPVYRKFSGIEEQNDWFSAADKPMLSPFLDTDLEEPPAFIKSDLRFGRVLQTGVLEIKSLLKTYENRLLKTGNFLNQSFEYDALEFVSSNNSLRYKGMTARQIVFCEGFGLKNNPFFNNLPLRGNKGEYLIVRAEKLKLKTAIKSAFFFIPLGNDCYKFGATYARDFSDQNPSETAREQLTKKLDELLECPYTIVGQQAGVRPTTPDRRPMVGRHFEHQNLYVCNGFGSRGILSGPTVTTQLIDFIEKRIALPSEIDVQRFMCGH